MLDLVQEHLIKGSGISSLRLDGSTPTQQRQLIADQFNQDPTIDILLLTTSVGGLGLTLTGADTVIFLEHDWNPSKDMQAMDRAHRLGQKKTVHVYRLITQDTLEEKIMSLQQFKKNVSNAVISADNKSIGSMGTDQLLDLFQAPDPANPAGNVQTVRVIVCCACFTVGSTFSLVSAWLFFYGCCESAARRHRKTSRPRTRFDIISCLCVVRLCGRPARLRCHKRQPCRWPGRTGTSPSTTTSLTSMPLFLQPTSESKLDVFFLLN